MVRYILFMSLLALASPGLAVSRGQFKPQYAPEKRQMDLLRESQQAQLGLEYSLQGIKARPSSQFRLMAGLREASGSSVSSFHTQLNYRFSKFGSRWYGLFDVGYAREDSEPSSPTRRTYHHIPVTLGPAYIYTFRDHWFSSAAIAPTARIVMQRGYSTESNRSDLFWDAVAQLGFGYQFQGSFPNELSSVGVKWNHYAGLANQARATTADEFLVDYSFDL